MLLPEPDGPMIAVNVPRGSAIETSSSARTALRPPPYTLFTDSNLTAYVIVIPESYGERTPTLSSCPTITASASRSGPNMLPNSLINRDVNKAASRGRTWNNLGSRNTTSSGERASAFNRRRKILGAVPRIRGN
ncbi:hypothetical protein Msi02_06310 [Microbispora siamensis]|uniref:Uncharacterized protein n=1 Tax=Microbispora siamensis TaxID=564413 RepID=A0ABQ4GEI0_9ACTN|nr:hypothetical protein Msi02_06310 [Microbispora siamensis]